MYNKLMHDTLEGWLCVWGGGGSGVGGDPLIGSLFPFKKNDLATCISAFLLPGP